MAIVSQKKKGIKQFMENSQSQVLTRQDMRDALAPLAEEQANLRRDVSHIQEDVSHLQEDVKQLAEGQKEIRQDLQNFRHDMHTMLRERIGIGEERVRLTHWLIGIIIIGWPVVWKILDKFFP